MQELQYKENSCAWAKYLSVSSANFCRGDTTVLNGVTSFLFILKNMPSIQWFTNKIYSSLLMMVLVTNGVLSTTLYTDCEAFFEGKVYEQENVISDTSPTLMKGSTTRQ